MSPFGSNFALAVNEVRLGDLIDLRDAIEDRRSRLAGEPDEGAELDRTGIHDLVRERTATQSDDSLDRHQE